MKKPDIKAFFDEATFTVSYIVSDPETAYCVIIDSVLDYDPASGRTSTGSADAMIAYVEEKGLEPELILDTHVHADHLTAAPYLKAKFDAETGIGDQVPIIQDTFGAIFNAEPDFKRDGSQFDYLFSDGAHFTVGNIPARVLHTPGHTPACSAYVIGDAVFVGDTMFMPDYGTARCDFPGGDARTLYRSIQKLFELPDETRVFVCHDYLPSGREQYVWETTIGEQKAKNVHVGGGVSEDDFVKMREEKDATLAMPTLILPSVQVNMRAGAFPPAEENGVSYLKLPLNQF